MKIHPALESVIADLEKHGSWGWARRIREGVEQQMTHFGARCMVCDNLLDYNHTDIGLLREKCIPCLYESVATTLELMRVVIYDRLMKQKLQEQHPGDALEVLWATKQLNNALVRAAGVRTMREAAPSSTPSSESSKTTAGSSPVPPDPTATTT